MLLIKNQTKNCKIFFILLSRSTNFRFLWRSDQSSRDWLEFEMNIGNDSEEFAEECLVVAK